MEIKQKNSRNKIWLIVALVIIFFALLGGYLVYAANGNLIPSSKSTDSSKSSNKSSDSSQEKKSDDKIIPPNTDHADSPAADESTGKQIIPVVASATVNGNTVYIRGGLNILRTDGTCYADITGPNGEKIRKDTTLLPNASTTDCKTISIPVSELSSGNWTFTLNYSASDAEGQSSVASFAVL